MVKPKSLILLGMAPSRAGCTFSATEVWSVNTGYRQINMEFDGRVAFINKIFLAHTQVIHHDGFKVFDWDEMNAWAETYDVEIINTHRVKGLKAKFYPMERISDKFGAKMYFSDTIAYMLAYALYKSTTGSYKDKNLKLKEDGFKVIKFFGIDMREQDEYQYEKGGIEYWIGYAQGLGVEIELQETTSLMTTVTKFPYGKKHFKMKDIDPSGLLRKKRRKDKKVELVLDQKKVDALGLGEIAEMTE